MFRGQTLNYESLSVEQAPSNCLKQKKPTQKKGSVSLLAPHKTQVSKLKVLGSKPPCFNVTITRNIMRKKTWTIWKIFDKNLYEIVV